MKKIVAVTAFLACTFFMAHSQTDVRFGFQLSPAFSWMSANTNRVNGSGTNLGLKLGMVGEFYFQENYAVATGIGFFFNSGGTLLHERAGNFWVNSELPENCRSDMRSSNTMTKLKYNLQYVEIPIGLRMRTREFGYIRYFIEPRLGLAFNTQANGDVTSSGHDECQDVNIMEDVNLFNLFWGINGGIEYSVSESTSLVGGAGLQFGFADVTKDDDIVFVNNDPNNTADEKSKGVIRAFIIRLGVMF